MTKNDLVITPATWPSQKSYLEKTPAGLFNLVGWYGSTHEAARWRKVDEFLAVFNKKHVPGFDPQIEGWDPSYAEIEAEVMATASVIIIRLENNELINGSLGSIAEVGMALISAALRGQVVIVSIEDGLLTSLDDPGSVAQYMILEMFLEQTEANSQVSQFLQVHRGDDLGELATLACTAAQKQMKNDLVRLNFNKFLTQKARRSQNHPLRILLGGSGGPYAQAYKEIFYQKKKRLIERYASEGCRVKVLSEGAVADAWNIPYGSSDNLSVALAIRTLLSIELEAKYEADMLLVPLMAEAESKAAATEIGFLLLYALINGQNIKIFLEPFDPVDYVHHQFNDIEIKPNADEKSMRAALQHAGVPDATLALATQAETAETYNLLQGLVQGHLPTFKQVRQSLLGKTDAFSMADNTRRVRVLVQAHVEKLYADPRYPDFFDYATKI